MAIRVLLADDHGVLRAGLRSLLESEEEFLVVAEAWEGDQVLKLATKFQPDVVLLDLNMPGPGNIEITRRILEAAPKSRVLILTGHEEDGIAQEVLNAGAAGYIIKRVIGFELLSAIRAVHSGEIYVHPSMMRGILHPPAPAPAPKEKREKSPLTPRETEVLRLIAKGYSNRQIGETLKLSTRTVESHRANLMAKLGFSSRIDLVRYATEHKLTE